MAMEDTLFTGDVPFDFEPPHETNGCPKLARLIPLPGKGIKPFSRLPTPKRSQTLASLASALKSGGHQVSLRKKLRLVAYDKNYDGR